jgi:hypothetical protein
MVEKFTPEIIKFISENRSSVLGKLFLAIGIFIVIYIASTFLVSKIKKRIEFNSLQNDIYTQKIAKIS